MPICHPPEPRSIIWLWSYETDPDATFWGAAETGFAWYNRTGKLFRYWDGTAIQDFGTYGSPDFDEIRLIPKLASTGAEGTMFYCSADDHVYVGTE